LSRHELCLLLSMKEGKAHIQRRMLWSPLICVLDGAHSSGREPRLWPLFGHGDFDKWVAYCYCTFLASWRWAGRSMGHLTNGCGGWEHMALISRSGPLRMGLHSGICRPPCTYSLQSISLRLQLSRAQMPREIIS